MNNNLRKPMSLRAIVAELLSSYNRVYPERAPLIVNDVSVKLFIYQRRNWLSPLLGDLYCLLSEFPSDYKIHIAAKTVRGEVKLYISRRQQNKHSYLAKTIFALCTGPRFDFKDLAFGKTGSRINNFIQ